METISPNEIINYCANHFVISNIAGNHCDITMNDSYIGVAHKGSKYKDYYPIGFGFYTMSFVPKLLLKYNISRVESYKDFIKNETSEIACIGFSEANQGWLGWSHQACHFFKIGYVVEEGSLCTKTGWTEDYDYEKQHPERCFNLPVGFTCKTLDDCRKCAIAYAMAVA